MFTPSEITTYETLLRPIEVFQIPKPQPVSVVSEKIKASERRREKNRLKQIQANKKKRKREVEGNVELSECTVPDGEQERTQAAVMRTKRLRTDEDVTIEQQETGLVTDPSDTVPTTTTVPLSNAELEGNAKCLSSTPVSDHTDYPRQSGPISTDHIPIPTSSSDIPSSTETQAESTSTLIKVNVSKALPEVRGHTSYLTFACLVPIRSSNLPLSSASASISELVGTADDEVAESSETKSAASTLATSNKDNE